MGPTYDPISFNPVKGNKSEGPSFHHLSHAHFSIPFDVFKETCQKIKEMIEIGRT